MDQRETPLHELASNIRRFVESFKRTGGPPKKLNGCAVACCCVVCLPCTTACCLWSVLGRLVKCLTGCAPTTECCDGCLSAVARAPFETDELPRVDLASSYAGCIGASMDELYAALRAILEYIEVDLHFNSDMHFKYKVVHCLVCPFAPDATPSDASEAIRHIIRVLWIVVDEEPVDASSPTHRSHWAVNPVYQGVREATA